MKKTVAMLSVVTGCASAPVQPAAMPVAGEGQGAVAAGHLSVVRAPRVDANASRSEDRRALTRDWSGVAECESGGNWHDTEGMFEGGLQFLNSTWLANGGGEFAAHAYDATAAEQVIVADRVLTHSSWTTQWPICGRYLKDLRRPVPQPNSAPAGKGEAPAGGIRGAA